ncbi:MAG: hypothetical protein HQL95_16690 [Magnetococcales bacterium]|nr:hypothetical protein [Magnetococcales bacterium]
MTSTTFDTLESIELLKSAGVPEAQARGHIQVLSNVIRQMELRMDDLSSRRDKQADTHLEALAERNEREVRGRLNGLATRQEMDVKLKELEISLKRDIKDLEVRIAESKAEIIKWMFGVAAAQSALFITMIKMFPGH